MAALISKPRDLLHSMNDRGISFQGIGIYDWSKALTSDPDDRTGFGRYSIDLFMPVDGKKLIGLEGSAALVRLKNHINHFGETYDGATQLDSNIDAPSRTTLYEIWFEQRLFSNKLRLKAGKIDANTEFAAVQLASDFLNSSMGYSPTIMAFPTYPEPKLGVNVFLHPRTNYGLGMGVFQTAGMGTLTILEGGHTWNAGQNEQAGRVSLGYWHENGTMGRFDGGQALGAQGYYSVVEQSVWRQPSTGNQGERQLAAYFQFGQAESKVSPYTYHFGGGSVLQGPFRKRSQDAIGMAATWVRFSQQPGAGFDLPSELALEGYYKAALNKHVALVQDFQFLHHPGGLRANRDCVVITPRLVISF
jgi:porin